MSLNTSQFLSNTTTVQSTPQKVLLRPGTVIHARVLVVRHKAGWLVAALWFTCKYPGQQVLHTACSPHSQAVQCPWLQPTHPTSLLAWLNSQCFAVLFLFVVTPYVSSLAEKWMLKSMNKDGNTIFKYVGNRIQVTTEEK